jgi:hypothetical protein
MQKRMRKIHFLMRFLIAAFAVLPDKALSLFPKIPVAPLPVICEADNHVACIKDSQNAAA